MPLTGSRPTLPGFLPILLLVEAALLGEPRQGSHTFAAIDGAFGRCDGAHVNEFRLSVG